MSAADLPRVLFVDDEENVLVGINRLLHARYRISLAVTTDDALQQLETSEFDVIVSDMRMPGMDGNAFLLRARARQPDAVRLVLSGHSDLEAAAAAINDGRVFRFLIKPARKEALIAALDAAIEQRRLVRAEKELLEQTVTGSIDALSELLSLASPLAFGRSRRLKRIVSLLAVELKLSRRWMLEVAASVSQLGAISLPPDLLQRRAASEPLSAAESAMVARGNAMARQLLSRIPRMDEVVSLLEALEQDGPGASIEVSTLKLAATIEGRLEAGEPIDAIITSLESSRSFDAAAFVAVRKLRALLVGTGSQRQVAVVALQPGMVLVDDVLTRSGALLIRRGHEVSDSLMVRLRNFAATIGVKEPLTVFVTD